MTGGETRSDHAAGGRMVITKMSVSLIRTGPTSPEEYQRKLLQCHCSGESTSPPRHRIAMNVAQLLNSLLLRPNIEIIKPRLPEAIWFSGTINTGGAPMSRCFCETWERRCPPNYELLQASTPGLQSPESPAAARSPISARARS